MSQNLTFVKLGTHLSPYLRERIIKVLPLSGFCYQEYAVSWVVSSLLIPPFLCPCRSPVFSGFRRFLFVFSFAVCFLPPSVNGDWRFYAVTLYGNVSCTLWWGQMAARTNPVPHSEMRVFTSRKESQGQWWWESLLLIMFDSQRSSHITEAIAPISNINECQCEVETDRKGALTFQPVSSDLQ